MCGPTRLSDAPVERKVPFHSGMALITNDQGGPPSAQCVVRPDDVAVVPRYRRGMRTWMARVRDAA